VAWHSLRSAEDFWAHAAAGRWAWQHREVPRQTLFLWSASEPWVAHSWLSSLVFYGLAALGDGGAPWAAPAFVSLMAALPFARLGCLWPRRVASPSLLLVAFVLAIQASAVRFRARPELFTSLFFCVLLVFLVHWAESARAGPDAPLPPRDRRRALALLLV